MIRNRRRGWIKRKRKKEKKAKKSKKREDVAGGSSGPEEGEVKEDEPHPLVSITDIKPEEIPDVPVNKFLMRGGPLSNDKDKKDKRGRDFDRRDNDRTKIRDRLGGKPDWRNQRGYGEWGDRRRRGEKHAPATTKSGRLIRGRGVFRYRTPSRSRSRSVTPKHWKMAESRVMKLSEFEKKESEWKQLEEENIKREADRKRRHEQRKAEDVDAEKLQTESRNEDKDAVPVDYNALDYEENNDQSDKEDVNDPATQSKSEVPELVQYPPPGSFKPIVKDDYKIQDAETTEHKKSSEENKENTADDKDIGDDLVMNKKSEVLARALGVEIKRGEDPESANATISGYDKKRNLQEKFTNNFQTTEHQKNENIHIHTIRMLPSITAKLLEMSDTTKIPRSEIHPRQFAENANNDSKIMLPINARREEHDFKRGTNREKDGIQYDNRRNNRSELRRRSFDRNMRPQQRFNSGNSYNNHNHNDRFRRRSRSRDRRRKSPARGRDRRRSRSCDRSEKRRLRSVDQKPRKSRSSERKKPVSETSPKERKLTPDKKVESNAEKMKRRAGQLLILKKKMELEMEIRRKTEEKRKEQAIIEEKQRKAKEEAEMLEKAKKAKREQEKEKLFEKIQAAKAFKEQLQNKGPPRKICRSRSSSSDSSTSSSSSSPSPRRRRSSPRRRRSTSSSSSSSRSRSRNRHGRNRDSRRK